MKVSFNGGTLTAVSETKDESLKLMETLVADGFKLDGIVKRQYAINGNAPAKRTYSKRGPYKAALADGWRQRILDLGVGQTMEISKGEWHRKTDPSSYCAFLKKDMRTKGQTREYKTKTHFDHFAVTRLA